MIHKCMAESALNASRIAHWNPRNVTPSRSVWTQTKIGLTPASSKTAICKPSIFMSISENHSGLSVSYQGVVSID